MSEINPDRVCELCRFMLQPNDILQSVNYLGRIINVCLRCKRLFCSACNSQQVKYTVTNKETLEVLYVCETCVKQYAKKGAQWLLLGECKPRPQGPALGR